LQAAAGLELAPLRRIGGTVEEHASALAAAADDPAVHSIVVVDTTPGPLPPDGLASEILATSAARPDLTVVVATVGGERPARLVDDERGTAVPVFTFPEHAANALGRLAAVGEWRSSARVYGDDAPSGADVERARELVDGWRDGAGGADELELDHEQQEALLGAFGLSIADRRTVRTADEAVAAALELGWPVALKAQRRDRKKRTALSGVALDIADEDDLRNTWARMEAALGSDGMLPAVVQRFVEQGLDVAVRVRRSGNVGTVEVGLGGPAAAFDPWELGVLPLTLPDASVLVASSSVGRALTDPIERVPVVALVHRLAALADAVDEIHEIVADPVIASGPTTWITDVRITVGEPQGDLPVRHLA
jgi:hypothetical protein